MKKILPYFLSLFILSACQKGDNDSVKSSEKNIGEVVFKATDNPSLSKDVTGSLNGDSIKIVFSKNISLKNLIPTITFSGKNISPANKVPQDFTNPVTYTITAEDGSTRKIIFAGSNRLQSDSMILLSGKWSLVRDSVSNIGHFYFPDFGEPGSGDYYGTSVDYYDFRLNGEVEAFENGNKAKAPYELKPGNKIDIEALISGDILTLTETSAIFTWSLTSPNGGKFFKKIILKR